MGTTMHTSTATRLVADVGGTNSRLALFDPASDQLYAISTYVNRDHSRFEDIIGLWLEALDHPAPTNCCIAVAAPPAADRVTMINMDWSFSCRELAALFGFSHLQWINDFEANAYSLPHLTSSDLVTLRDGSYSAKPLAVVGPGTGLGGATFENIAGRPHVRASEPGHMGLAAATTLELELLSLLLRMHGEVHTELLVSGPGLQRLYRTLAQIHDQEAQELTPADISRRALAGEDTLSVTALSVYCGLLGSVCGDFVLANGAYGGLYLAGGIIPQIIPFLKESEFEQRFDAKGAMGEHLRQVALHVITTSQPGLIGAAHAPLGISQQ
jgi:glucokinase